MLTRVKSATRRHEGGRFAIVASEYNARYVNAMVAAAKKELTRAGARVDLIRVPGAFEIPVATARLARAGSDRPQQTPAAYSAILCLGVILRGETTHAAHIGEAVTHALMEIQLRYEVPVIHEVLLLESAEQARVRCLGREHNRGLEAARTALKMAALMKRLGGSKSR